MTPSEAYRQGEQDGVLKRPFRYFSDPASREAQAYLAGYKAVRRFGDLDEPEPRQAA